MNEGIIYHGNSIISIETLPDYAQPVVIKKPAKHHASRRNIRSLENEYEMTRSLNAVEGVRQALAQRSIENQPALILEYIEGETLRDTIARKTLSLSEKLEIAVDLARILGEIHQQNLIHLDLNSKNILIGNKQQAVHLIDLGSAAHIDRSGRQKVRPDQMLGTLPYISPEQTGRINRAVDERSDLYSLGVVLYELMTRQLPFDSKDPLKLVHDHIARTPVSPSEVSPETPEVISAIILKLLRKNAEDRYQSAAGVQADLEKCLQRLSPEDTIEEFPLGEADYASWLRFPQKLYGRDRELKELERAFESVCRDTSSIVFVGGYSGIGKTALVEEIQRPVSEKSGYFIEGKFDQLATTPYAGITQAFAPFVSQILAQTETQLAAWRSQILEALGPNGRVLTDVVPSLELVIGPQPAVPDLNGQEGQNRFNYVFQRFFGAIARCEHPICFFLDDLQWIDPGSLGLLKNLFSSPDLAHLLVVGAYRDNEVHEDHPLMTLIADLEKAGVNLKQITLNKLSEADIEALISDTLQSNQDETRELSRLVYSQTDGNPFFARQVLGSLEDRGLIALDTATGHWRWDIDALRGQDVTASVVELLVGKLKELPVDIQETLKVAACIGNQFDIATLTVVTAGDDDAILDHVQKAVAAGLIWERDARGFFVHDRVQEAAYALVPPEDRDRTHLTIGRLLLQRPRTSDDEQDIFRIVDQWNHGLHLVEDEQERMQIARLNLQAARAARRATAFETGLNYARAVIELLGENSWEQDYRLTLALHEQAALMAHAAGDIPGMKHYGEQVLQRGRDPLDLARVQRLYIEFLLSSKRFEEAIDFGLKALSILGQEFPPNPDMGFSIAKFSELLDRLEREPPDYFSMPRLYDQDPELLAISEILMPLANAAFISRPALAPLFVIRTLELSLERQHLPESIPRWIVSAGLYANAILGKVDVAHEYGEKAAALASQAAFHTNMCSALHIHGKFIYFWRKPLRETLGLFDRALQSAHDCGNHECASFATFSWSNHAFYASIELAQVKERAIRLRAFVDGIQYVTQSRWVNIIVSAVQALRESSSARGTSWRGGAFDDGRDLPDMDHSGDQLGLLFAYCAKAWVATLFGDHYGVEEYSDLSSSFLEAGPSGLENAIVPFICGLRYARELREKPDGSGSEQALQEQLDLLERFAGLAPMNFAHKLWLVQAEVHRTRGEVLQAMQAYEQASQGARENGYLSEAGLAHALAAEFFQDLGLHQAALHNAEQAAQAWRSWGAHALVESLSHRFADLLETSGLSWQSSSDAGKVHPTITQPITPIQLDIESIISTSQMLSAETDLEQLLTKMITLVMANSGAETAVLLLKQDNDWFVQARGDSASEKYDILLNQPFDPADRETDLIPESVFNYCRRTEAVLVVGDVKLDDRFAEDRMIREHKVQSMACIPVLSQGELKSMLYLENRHVADVFTLENVSIVKHLSAQFGVSVENALLYDSLNQKVQELQESEEGYQLAVAGSAAGLWDWDLRADKVYYSDRFKELLGYTPDEIQDTLDEFWNRVHPADYEAVQSAVDQHLKEHTPYQIDYRLQTKSGEYRWFHARGQALWDRTGKATRMSGSITDITERKQAETELAKHRDHLEDLVEKRTAQLEQEIAERKKAESELQSQVILFNSLLDTVPDTIAIIDPYTFKYIKWNNASVQVTGYSDKEFATLDPVASLFDEAEARRVEAAVDQAMREGQTVVAANTITKDGRRIPMEYTGSLAGDAEGNPLYFIAIGRDITERKQAELALQQSNQALTKRLDELSTLNLIGQAVSTVVDLPDALDLVVATITRSFDALGTGILLLSGDRSELTLVSFFDRRFPVFSIAGNSEDIPTNSAQRGMVFPVKDGLLTQELLGEDQSIVIPDAQHDPRLSEAHYILQAGQVGCLMLVPLLSKRNAIGLIGIATDQPEREFTPDEVMLVETIAGQITGAIETARLFEQVQNVAALEERNRLAQDLHDSVTQAIYSASLIAETVPVVWEIDREEGQRGLKQLHRLTQGALAEMRTLLLELRPITLADQDLPTLLRQLEVATMARTETVVTTTVVGDCAVPTDVKVALYRITQEALNNVVKHARARQAWVTLRDDGLQITLSISDDGCGFDPEAEPPHQLGLNIMRDRAQSVGAMLSITSEPDQGTEVLVVWQAGEE